MRTVDLCLVLEDLEREIESSGRVILWDELDVWDRHGYDNNRRRYERDPMRRREYSQSMLDVLRKAYKAVSVASVYMRRCDEFVGGKLSEEALKDAIKGDIKNIKKV